MITGSVLTLLVFDLLLFLLAAFWFDKSSQRWESLFLSALFFCSGMPALIYQIVWQRTLFAIYGVNSESVAVVVSAFMLGLGLGSLAGGWLASRFPRQGILFFGAAELGVAVFGLISLRIFHWAAAYTSGAALPSVIFFSFILLLIPTMLMGATLPLLVEHLVRRSGSVGGAVSRLYFVNTFGSAVACYLCASFLLRGFAQSGSVSIAACLNALVGASAYLYGRRPHRPSEEGSSGTVKPEVGPLPLSLEVAMFLAGMSGFVALGFEIAWFRVFALASSDRAPAFALLLSTYLAGIAAGSYLSEKASERWGASSTVQFIGVLLLLAGAISAYLPPLVAACMARGIPFLASAPAFFLTAALLGSVLPLLCQLSVSADQSAGRGVSLVYVSNIFGSTLGSLGIGFVLMQHFGLRQVSLGLAAVLLGAGVLFFRGQKLAMPPAWVLGVLVASLAAVLAASPLYAGIFEKLIFGSGTAASVPFAHIVENRNGVIGVTQDAAVFGGGLYDGFFNVDPINDSNFVVRAYALSAFHPAPKRMLVIGLTSGSWAQIFANDSQVESLDIVEINPGYLQLIPLYPVVRSLLENPKVHLYVDDGRRWLLAHPGARYDAIVANTMYHWRDHSTVLLSVEYLQLIRTHLNSGGVYYFNTTESDETIATALRVYPYGLRVINFLAVSDSPIILDKEHWLDVLRRYSIDNKIVFDPLNPAAAHKLLQYMAFAETVHLPPRFPGFESSDSLRAPRPEAYHHRRQHGVGVARSPCDPLALSL